jgi:hypothetical protein
MVAQLLLNLVADAIFRSVGARHRSYEADIDRYLGARGIVLEPKPAAVR